MPKGGERRGIRNSGFGERLHQARSLWEYSHGRATLQQLAEVVNEAGVDVRWQTIQRWLAGYEPKSLETIQRLARALEVEPGWLAFGRGPKRWTEPPAITEEPDEEEPVDTAPGRRPKRRPA